MLSVDDLIKIEKLIMGLLGDRIINIESELRQIKKNQQILQDGQVQIRKELDTEHEVRRQHIEDNTQRIDRIENHLNLK